VGKKWTLFINRKIGIFFDAEEKEQEKYTSKKYIRGVVSKIVWDISLTFDGKPTPQSEGKEIKKKIKNQMEWISIS
jgi:hypothetical protein